MIISESITQHVIRNGTPSFSGLGLRELVLGRHGNVVAVKYAVTVSAVWPVAVMNSVEFCHYLIFLLFLLSP
jgi:hypothetical protein